MLKLTFKSQLIVMHVTYASFFKILSSCVCSEYCEMISEKRHNKC
jgi:hypothetical protein